MTYRPELYDLMTPSSFQGDVDWYRRKAEEGGGPVLELGAGTGRVTLAIAEAGITIHALDSSEGMLDVLREKLKVSPQDIRSRVIPVHADMRTFELPERFALIIAPFRTFLHNLTEQDRLACLERVRRHLLPNGRFAFNVFHPSLEFMSQHAGALAGVWRWTATREMPTGGFLVRSETNRYDTVHQIVYSQHRYEEYTATGRSFERRCTGSSLPISIPPIFGGCSSRPVSTRSRSAEGSRAASLHAMPTSWSSRPQCKTFQWPRSSAGTRRAGTGALLLLAPMSWFAPMREIREKNWSLWLVRMGGRLFMLLGVLALFVATVGLYGVRAFLMSRRTREIGVRMALGATRGNVLRQMMRESMTLTVTGLAVGLVLAVVTGRVLSSLLYRVSPADPWAFVGATVILALAAAVASWLPVRKALRIQPSAALRYE